MTLAAEELHVTHGAISRHIKTLESHLGTPLFRRLTRKIVLTETGAEYHAAIARLLGDLTNETERLRGQSAVARLRVSTSVSFASKWLAPRLHRFKDRHKELDVYLDVTDVNVDLGDGQIDAAIRYGSGRYPHVVAERILDETVTPVCSPSYLAAIGGLLRPGELMRCKLLHEDRMLANWEQWFAMAGLDGVRIHRGAAYSHGSIAIDAAIRGEGVALGRTALVTDDIVGGKLVAPFPHIRLKAERGYDLVYRQGNRDHPKVKLLRDWLADEVGQFVEDAKSVFSKEDA